MISHDYRAIFVHIPKVAGQSVELAFLNLHGLTWEGRAPLLLRHNDDPAKGPARLAHLLAREYVQLGYVDRETFDTYYTFAFVRNPWDRLVSEYRYRKSAQVMPFAVFVDRQFSNIDMYTDQSRHIIPQSDYLDDADGTLMVDFVGRFETLTRDFRAASDAMKLGVDEMPRRNVSGHSRLRKLFKMNEPAKKPFQDYYDDALRDRVGEFYRRDIERFGYAFDGSFRDEPII